MGSLAYEMMTIFKYCGVEGIIFNQKRKGKPEDLMSPLKRFCRASDRHPVREDTHVYSISEFCMSE